METIGWFPSDILNTEDQLLTPITEEIEQLGAAHPTPPEPPAALPTEPVTAALDGEPLPADPEAATTPKTLSRHPAVVVYRDTFLAFPSRAQMHQIVQAGVTDLEQWQRVTRTWLGRGYSPRNIGGMLEWYGDPARMTNGSGKTNGHHAPQPAEAPVDWGQYAKPVGDPKWDEVEVNF